MIAWPPHLNSQMSWNVHHSEIVTATSLKSDIGELREPPIAA